MFFYIWLIICFLLIWTQQWFVAGRTRNKTSLKMFNVRMIWHFCLLRYCVWNPCIAAVIFPHQYPTIFRYNLPSAKPGLLLNDKLAINPVQRQHSSYMATKNLRKWTLINDRCVYTIYLPTVVRPIKSNALTSSTYVYYICYICHNRPSGCLPRVVLTSSNNIIPWGDTAIAEVRVGVGCGCGCGREFKE